VDYHEKYSYVVVKEFQQVLKPYRSGKAVLEAIRNWGLICDWLEEILDDSMKTEVKGRIQELVEKAVSIRTKG
jgi:hypothetical protein